MHFRSRVRPRHAIDRPSEVGSIINISFLAVVIGAMATTTPCSNKKGATKLMAVTSSNLNRFSKFFYRWKAKEIYNNKTMCYFPPHLKYVATLPLGI